MRWNKENADKNKNSDCVKHLNYKFDYESQWFTLPRTTKNNLKRKTVEWRRFTCRFSYDKIFTFKSF